MDEVIYKEWQVKDGRDPMLGRNIRCLYSCPKCKWVWAFDKDYGEGTPKRITKQIEEHICDV